MFKKITIYKDSKVLPLYNFERIVETGNYKYLIRGYEDGHEVNTDLDLEAEYNKIITHYLQDLNKKNTNLKHYGTMLKAENEIYYTKKAIDFIKKNQEIKIYQGIHKVFGEDIGNYDEAITSYLKALRIQIVEDPQKQISLLEKRIIKKKNDFSKAEKAIELSKLGEDEEKHDVSKMVASVELILERTIDMEKTSLYRFSIMQQQAESKIKKMTQKHGKR